MEIPNIRVEKEEIESELNDLKQAMDKGFLSKSNRLVQDLLKVYGHLKFGGKVIDIHEAFRKASVDHNTDPKLAIIRADARVCYLKKFSNGGALFSMQKLDWNRSYPLKSLGDIHIPSGTFTWDLQQNDEQRYRKTLVPMIPPRVILTVSIRLTPQHYHIIFEPESWSKSAPRPPKDPIIGKMLTSNLFGVLAHWELTDLEAKIVEGRL